MLFTDNRMIFLDRKNIDSSEMVALQMNPPTKMGPCFSVETEWELKSSHAYCIVRWEDQWRMYYKTSTEDGTCALGLLISNDGITWERPELGVVSYKGSKANNLVDISGEKPGEICVFVDPSAPDEERFKLVCHQQAGGGMWALSSPDGLRFRRVDGLLLKFITDNNKAAFYDERIGKYVIYLRGWDRDREIGVIGGTRCILRAVTDDLHKPIPIDEDAANPWPLSPKWTDIIDGGLRRMNNELPKVMRCDELDPPEAGLYQAATVHYLRDAYVAFPTLYFSYPPPPVGPYINDGVLDLQFASSSDGIKWIRDFRGSYVRLDLPDGHCTKLMHMLTGMVPHGYRISQYYGGSTFSHGEGRTAKDVKPVRPRSKMGDPRVYRLEQRMDGFVSADSAYTGGVLVTKPFVIESDQLRLNIDTSASGVAHAALLAEDGSAIPGFGLEECDRIQGNDTQYVLSWKGSRDVSGLKGKAVKLLLKSRSTKLFAVYP